MIQAYKNTTLTGVQVRTLAIRQKELEYWRSTFQTMAGQSAMLTGFCYGGLSLSARADNQWADAISFGYLASTTGAMGFGLLTIIVAALCSMLGPGLALRGAEGAGSVHKAVDTMKAESVNCFNFFIFQLFMFHISSFLLMWVLYTTRVAAVVNVVLLIFLIVFAVNGYDIYRKLHISEDQAVSGKFADFSQYQRMNDLDREGGLGAGGQEYSGGAADSGKGAPTSDWAVQAHAVPPRHGQRQFLPARKGSRSFFELMFGGGSSAAPSASQGPTLTGGAQAQQDTEGAAGNPGSRSGMQLGPNGAESDPFFNRPRSAQ